MRLLLYLQIVLAILSGAINHAAANAVDWTIPNTRVRTLTAHPMARTRINYLPDARPIHFCAVKGRKTGFKLNFRDRLCGL